MSSRHVHVLRVFSARCKSPLGNSAPVSLRGWKLCLPGEKRLGPLMSALTERGEADLSASFVGFTHCTLGSAPYTPNCKRRTEENACFHKNVQATVP